MIKRLSFRSPALWALFLILSALGGWFTIKYFDQASPIVNLDIKIDRDDAIEQALVIAKKFNWVQKNDRSAAAFNHNSILQYYIELEAGGPEAFKNLIDENLYAPYHWAVRLFNEHQIKETTIFFKPDGSRFGFIHTIPEKEPGVALNEEKAREIALNEVKQHLPVNMALFKEVEDSQDTKQSGRIDHTFVFERTDKKIGEAPYRLTLIVRGDKLCQATLNIKVPESFTRSYSEMRSTNNTIARIATIIMYILYFFGGVLGGLFYLLRRKRHLIWSIPLIWAFGISLLSFLSMLNKTPLYWMQYNTALSAQSFLMQIIFGSIQNFMYNIGITSVIILAAESLGSVAFPNHIRLWTLWSKSNSATIQTIGRTLGGYLTLGIKFAYVIAFYMLALKYLGWWSPSEMLSDPNILATFFPWLGPVANSLYAGFIEECLFRAIPLSIAAIIGQRFGKRNLAIGIAFLLQAVVFSAAHANYAAQPAYARLVELMIPSFMYAGIFLAFGLLPAIITHVVYDVLLMALPIWVTSAPGIWIDKTILLVFAGIPAFIIIAGMIRSKGWHEIPKEYFYKFWQPPARKEIIIKEHRELKKKYKPQSIYLFLLIGILGLCSWIFFTKFSFDVEPLTISRDEAIELAQKNGPEKIANQKEWKSFARIINDKDEVFKQEGISKQHIFSWRIGGKTLYHQLLGSFLNPLLWYVRFVKTNGSLAERAEEYHYFLSGNGTLIRVQHILPEDMAAAERTKDAARKIIDEKLNQNTQESITEISAVRKKHPNREDWIFTYTAFTEGLQDGEKRLQVTVAGDEVIDSVKSIFVPEEWKREYTREQTFKKLVSQGLMLLTLLLLAFLIINLMIRTRAEFSWKAAGIVAGFFIIKTMLLILNQLPVIYSTFKTTEPFNHQLFATLTAALVKTTLKALVFGGIAGFIHKLTFRCPQIYTQLKEQISLGVSVGIVFAAAESVMNYFGPSLKPLWPTILQASSSFPSLSIMLYNLGNFLEGTLISILLIILIDYLTNCWHKHQLLGAFIFIILGLASQDYTTLGYWVLAGVLSGAALLGIYLFAFRFSKAAIPISFGVYFGLKALHEGMFNAFPGALLGGLLSISSILLAAYFWTKYTNKADLKA